MKFKVWTDEKEVCETCGQEIKKSDEYVYLKLKNYEEGVRIVMVNSSGNLIESPYILIINNNGTLMRYNSVNPDYVQRDKDTKIKLSE